METRDNKPDSEETGHLAQVIKPKKSNKKLYGILAAVVVVFILVIGGVLGYSILQDADKTEDKTADTTAKVDDRKDLPEEERLILESADALEAAVKEEEKVAEADDYTQAIKNSTAAAVSVGKDVKENDLEE